MSNFVLALMITLGMTVPVSVILARVDAADLEAEGAGSPERHERTESTEHEGFNCRHCADLAIPPGLVGRVYVPRQRGEQA
ncbi:hypothetical protein [Streptomyces sp. H27-H5]|uniref:hypothetical protein n=1 Tax=Streptomyces sp. H27-H5 TaxID=2996460 RepID=UPI002270A047|nr:hypothetical protein [Streptomyces sp. H27-H5]MCY0957654.1 hypothetical protein [Streptomyces sp. H27-H5]